MAKRRARRRFGKTNFRTQVGSDKNRRQRKSHGRYLKIPSNIPVFKEPPGSRVKLDFLPYPVTDPNHPDRDDEYNTALEGNLWYKRSFRRHRDIGPDDVSLVCPTSVGKPCPVCKARNKLIEDGADWQDKAVKALKWSLRNLYVVLPLKDKDHDEKPHLWDMADYLFQQKLDDELDEDKDFRVFPSLDEGLTLGVRFSVETYKGAKYAGTSRIDFYDRRRPYDEDILDEVPNLDEVLIIESYDSIRAMLYDDEDRDDPPAEGSSRTRRRPRDRQRQEEGPEQPRRRRRIRTLKDDPGDQPRSRSRKRREEPEQPRRRRRSRRQEPEPEPEPEPKSEGECPEGYRFGHDNEEYPECENCEVWDACMARLEELDSQ